MMSLTPIINLLKTPPAGFPHPWFRQVAGAAEFARAREDALPLPACWIVRAAERVKHAGERLEDCTFIFDVVIAIENARPHGDGDTDDELLDYRKAIKTALLGWEGLAADADPIRFAGGSVLEYTAGDFYWRDRYEFGALIDNWLPDPIPAISDSGILHTEASANEHYL